MIPASAPFLVAGLSGLHAAGDSAYRAVEHDSNMNGRVFGGQLLAQCLLAAHSEAASNEADLWYPASLHCLFLHGASVQTPLNYTSRLLQSGRRFRSYRVEATQCTRNIVEAHVTLQAQLHGWEHERLAPEVPEPEQLPSLDALQGQDGRSYATYQRPGLEMRLTELDVMRHPSPAPATNF